MEGRLVFRSSSPGLAIATSALAINTGRP